MNEQSLAAAVAEAKRFLLRAADVKREIIVSGLVVGTKQSGALRRASLELTRALAAMRKP